MKYVLTLLLVFVLNGVAFSQEYKLLPVNVFNSTNQKFKLSTDGGLNSSQFNKSDIDLDGIDELVIYQRKAKNWLVYRFDAITATYNLDYQLSISLPMKSQDISILRDYDCDGKDDLFINEGNNLSVWKNVSTIGNITFDSVGLLYYGNDLIFNRNYDLPGIEDVDGDGDIDILCYGLNGIYLEYYKNLSMEMYGNCDSLVFELANECWGHFSEDNSSASIFNLFLLDTCINNVANPQKQMHTGTTVTVLDYDGDGIKDLLVGDVGYSNLVYAENFGNQVNENSSLINAQSIFPTNTIPINVDRFPAGYWLDINNDGVKDLVVSPNTDLASNNASATWYYQNFGSEGNPVLNHISSSFLQGEMIDLGYSSNISVTDFNNDGKKDIAISCYNTFSSSGTNQGSKIVMLENITQGDTLSFKTIDDFGALFNFSFNAISHCIADLESDGFKDIIFGDESGQIHLARQDINGNYTYSFGLTNSNGNTIDVGQFSTPQLFDYDDDGDLDLAIGNRQGKIAYYENIGTPFNYSFDSITSNMGNVNVLRDLINGGYSKPNFTKDINGNWNLWVGSYTGQNFNYTNIEGNANNSFTLVDSLDFKFGINSSIAVFETDHHNKSIFILGTERGGLSLFSNQDFDLTDNNINYINEITIRQLGTQIEINSMENIQSISMFNLIGQQVKYLAKTNSKFISFSIETLPTGVYIIKVKTDNSYTSKKIFLTND